MVHVDVSRYQGSIVEIIIKGHADSSNESIDMVCAQVSAISVGMLNAIDFFCEDACDIQMESGYISIHVIKDSKDLQVLLETLQIQLQTVEQTNYKYIQVNGREV